MISRRNLLIGTSLAGVLGFTLLRRPATQPALAAAAEHFPVTHTDAEWHKILTSQQYSILREAGTEYPFTSPLLNEHRPGVFTCAGCANEVFSSTTKFDSGTGWPSFWAPLDHAVGTETDTSFGTERTAVHCARCGGHLGHVFADGPKPTGLRYCMNGAAMGFKPQTT